MSDSEVVAQLPRDPSPDELKVIELGLKQPLSTIDMKAPQLLGVHFGKSHKKFILSMDKGMGKTIVYLTAGLDGFPEYVVIVPILRRQVWFRPWHQGATP